MIVRVLLFYFVCVSCEIFTKKVKDHCTRNCTNKPNNREVCGTDDQDYPSACHLKKSSCLLKSNVAVQYRGTCACPKSCPPDYRPVCVQKGSIEVTYSNKCRYLYEKCNLWENEAQNLKLIKAGPCKRWRRRACPESCRDIWAPVCGSDDNSYSSVCALKIANCQSASRIGLKKIGYCSKNACPSSCPEVYRPICSAVGQLFPNECEMRLAGCRVQNMKDYKRATRKRVCSEKCVQVCPEYGKNVCGSNGQTYSSFCELKRQNCVYNRDVHVQHDGACDNVSGENRTILGNLQFGNSELVVANAETMTP